MHSGKIVGGLILLAVAIYLFMYMTHPAAQYLGAAIVAILALASLVKGFKK